MFAGCNQTASSKKNGQAEFYAVVIELYESEASILVEPVAGEEILKSADRISVSTQLPSREKVPEIKVGDTVRIVYNGEVAETYPAQIHKVSEIYLVTE